jgi:hypothetical protein
VVLANYFGGYGKLLKRTGKISVRRSSYSWLFITLLETELYVPPRTTYSSAPAYMLILIIQILNTVSSSVSSRPRSFVRAPRLRSTASRQVALLLVVTFLLPKQLEPGITSWTQQRWLLVVRSLVRLTWMDSLGWIPSIGHRSRSCCEKRISQSSTMILEALSSVRLNHHQSSTRLPPPASAGGRGEIDNNDWSS